ncbi:hypothetical protein PVL30_004394 [Lodderomyces elongisporus]|uniref:Uncharacterized protein n=1 Tax=Lodderomyces elongisporus (strain ATCC 11503 / CBS 2605 / JCM 1781 / NBRC 1676 / NRRL YB-4239) TaxID=379508 RepID=A5E7N9_LODEL|nr:uncharacterized protein PVL30_004384 [Lodderomyces elongisporus]XP_001523084.1 uncharacterized protein PVL30_004386 [Lodderomyces elongisporus]XP_001523086.1 uncharacterized protein PVL30_004392 [Lodderomyces elongisporus]XP_001523089.1 uncharacterized protein PVL30_004394 [Lodderomyces elongisporus]XP_060975549.1 uncharacterized protein PVL30_004388 [Lodderomyces elongisporus]XP_060975550.1 uncharacterized protein PVL30_004390 [Lodderomyces elongisporus]EDK47447.1 predicted protein [Lodde
MKFVQLFFAIATLFATLNAIFFGYPNKTDGSIIFGLHDKREEAKPVPLPKREIKTGTASYRYGTGKRDTYPLPAWIPLEYLDGVVNSYLNHTIPRGKAGFDKVLEILHINATLASELYLFPNQTAIAWAGEVAIIRAIEREYAETHPAPKPF